MNRLFLFMTILVLGVPVYAQSEKRIDTKEKQENVNSRELKKQLAAIQDSINYKNAVSALENRILYWKQTSCCLKEAGQLSYRPIRILFLCRIIGRSYRWLRLTVEARTGWGV